ncbi:hypothetical protein AC1031_015054 [Aphanomyces cochlioides]|nr:hypothetical protein AC1031_015054 [Aphanomyces cochlioides]
MSPPPRRLKKPGIMLLEEDFNLSMSANTILNEEYAAVGILYGAIPALSYPLIKIYFGAEGYQIFMGGLSDCVPPSQAVDPHRLARETSLTTKVSNDHLSIYTLLSIVASDCASDCASDALVVQYAMREPLATRGRIQTAIYTVRAMGLIVGNLCVGVLLNSSKFGGEFKFSIGINVMYILLCLPCVLAMLATMITEDKTEMVPFRKWLHHFWQLAKKQAMWQVLAFRFISNVFQNFESVATSPLSQRVQPFMDGITKAIGYILYTLILGVVGRYSLNWNWRWTIALSTIGLVVIDLVTTYIDSFFSLTNDNFKLEANDTTSTEEKTHIRWQVSFFVAYGMKLLGLVWLPPQKAYVQRLKRYGMVSSFAGGLSMALFFFFLAFLRLFQLDLDLPLHVALQGDPASDQPPKPQLRDPRAALCTRSA